jgi:formate dehydrogenase major subunit
MARSVCPYCAVGCGQRVYVKVSKKPRHRPLRQTKVEYRRPHGTEWEELDLEVAMDMIADRVLATRERVQLKP